MDATSTAEMGINTALFAFSQAKEVKNQEVLSALGMTPETQKAQQQIENSDMQEIVSSATGQGSNIDIKA